MKLIRLKVTHPVGLHARPAARFVELASSFSSSVKISNLSTDSAPVDAKSILMVLTLGVHQGNEVEIQVDGEDEGAAVAALQELIEDDFGEK